MKVSVILPSLLECYPGAAKNRVSKLLRAINSFLTQSYTDSELILVSDGCEDTCLIYHGFFKDIPRIKLVKKERGILFSGLSRHDGICAASGEIICYLDSDDFFGNDHLKRVVEGFERNVSDWVYWNDYQYREPLDSLQKRNVCLDFGKVSTGCIAHKKDLAVIWPDGSGHDFKVVRMLQDKTFNYAKIEAEYYTCHTSEFDT